MRLVWVLGGAACLVLSACVDQAADNSASETQPSATVETAPEVVAPEVPVLEPVAASAELCKMIGEVTTVELGECAVFDIDGGLVAEIGGVGVPFVEVGPGSVFTPSAENLFPGAVYDTERDAWSGFNAVFAGKASEESGLCITVSGYARNQGEDTLMIVRSDRDDVATINVPVVADGISQKRFATPVQNVSGEGTFGIFSKDAGVKIKSIAFNDCNAG